MFSSKPFDTANRVQRLARYLDRSVMASSCLSGGVFVCASAAECRASTAGADFHEGQMSHVGEHYDLIEDGRPMRIVVVGQEVGTDEEHIGLLARRQQVLTGSGRQSAYHKLGEYQSRNPHMRGTTSALRLLLGGEPGEDREGELIELASGERVHLFDAFALVNALLCSAHEPGTKNGKSTATMRKNCRRHFEATLDVLEPTVVVVQGIGVWDWISDLFEDRRPIGANAAVARFHGREVYVAHLTHPSAHGEARWGDNLASKYLRETVALTLAKVRAMTAMPDSASDDLARLRALLPFVGRFNTLAAAGRWKGGEQEDGRTTWPWFHFSDESLAFIETCYKTGWVLNDDWHPWAKRAIEYRDHPERFASAPADRIARYLTAYLRGERFTEGVFAGCVETGAIRALLERIAVLAGERPESA